MQTAYEYIPEDKFSRYVSVEQYDTFIEIYLLESSDVGKIHLLPENVVIGHVDFVRLSQESSQTDFNLLFS